MGKAFIYNDSIVQATQFVGGAAAATPIIEEFLRRGMTATWMEEHGEVDFGGGHTVPASDERILYWHSEDLRVRFIHVGDWVITQGGSINVYSRERFYKHFQPYADANDETMQKVYTAIGKTVEDEKVMFGIIHDLQNAGIVFRELL